MIVDASPAPARYTTRSYHYKLEAGPGDLTTGASIGIQRATLAQVGHRKAAMHALDGARREVDAQADLKTFTAYSMPWYQLGRFASEVHTHLGDHDRAAAFRDESLSAYPPGSATDTTFMRLDAAEAMVHRGEPDGGAEQAAGALLMLPPEHRAPILVDRAVQVADLIARRGFEPERLRRVVEDARTDAP